MWTNLLKITSQRWLAVVALIFAVIALTDVANADTVTGALDRSSIKLLPTVRPFLLGASQAGARQVVVGERGIVMLSDDGGSNWRQSLTPVSVTLTSVRFADDTHGFAVGHGGVVLATSDAGVTWERRLDGRDIVKLILADAERSGDEVRIMQAKRFVEDGPDKPLLDLLVLDASRVVVVGAFGIALISEDGGHSWASWKERLDNPSELHLYAIRARGSQIVIAGEQGLVRLSEDAGKTFSTVTTPYDGSFFTLELVGVSDIVLAGLRGNVWKSEDLGHVWSQMVAPTPASIIASTLRADGAFVLVNQAGELLTERSGGLRALIDRPLPQLNGVLARSDGGLLLLGQQGTFIIGSGDLK